MDKTKEQYLDSKPNWESIMELRELEKTAYKRLRVMIEDDRLDDAGKVVGILREVGII